MRYLLGLFFLMMPTILWAAVIGYLLGLKVVLFLVLIVPTIILSFICKLVGKILISS